MNRILITVLLLFGLTVAAFGTDSAILPKSFGGWTQSGAAQTSTNPAQADAAYPAILKEYGFADAETATYVRNDGRKLTIKAARFNDATGAYGAFTFYRQPMMKTEEIGAKAASDNDRILFFRGNLLVDANFDRVTEMSAAELRELASWLPSAKGSSANLPTLPQYLRKDGAVANSEKYVLGPHALAQGKSVLTAEQINFNTDPEVLLQDYKSSDGPLTLTVINYPTPQIAGERLRALQASQQGNPQSVLARRTGPLLVVVSGAVESSEARALLNSVNYEAEVTWNEATSFSKRDNIGNLVIGIFTLIGVILLIATIFGVFFGGLRVVLKRLFPDKVFDRPEDVGIIRLNLGDSVDR